ncbi:MAG: hypothetical protein ACYTEL_09885 [Planctomycetota bacterium]|jgi:hypothetical protein
MLKRLLGRYGVWRVVNTALAAAVVTLALVFMLALFVPVRFELGRAGTSPGMNLSMANHLSEILQPQATSPSQVGKTIRPGLFKASTALRDKPMHDKTIERIKSQLRLQCIMKINGEPVAYINIENAGLMKCKEGDSVNDLFEVLSIDERSVETTIVGHKVTLTL